MKPGTDRSVTFSVVGGLFLATLAWADGTTSPGTNSVFVSASGLSLPSGSSAASLLTGTIAKGKKKTVVAVEGMLTELGESTERAESIWPTINGIALEPEFPETGRSHTAQVNCPPVNFPSSFCTVTGTWWLDIDAAEAAHPGMFIGHPLTVTLMGKESAGIGDSGLAATLTARVQKK